MYPNPSFDGVMAWVKYHTWRNKLGLENGPYIGIFMFYNDSHLRAKILPMDHVSIHFTRQKSTKQSHARVLTNWARSTPNLFTPKGCDWPLGRVDALTKGGPFIICIDRRLNRKMFKEMITDAYGLPRNTLVRLEPKRYRSRRNVSMLHG